MCFSKVVGWLDYAILHLYMYLCGSDDTLRQRTNFRVCLGIVLS